MPNQNEQLQKLAYIQQFLGPQAPQESIGGLLGGIDKLYGLQKIPGEIAETGARAGLLQAQAGGVNAKTEAERQMLPAELERTLAGTQQVRATTEGVNQENAWRPTNQTQQYQTRDIGNRAGEAGIESSRVGDQKNRLEIAAYMKQMGLPESVTNWSANGGPMPSMLPPGSHAPGAVNMAHSPALTDLGITPEMLGANPSLQKDAAKLMKRETFNSPEATNARQATAAAHEAVLKKLYPYLFDNSYYNNNGAVVGP